jgi:prepilin-type N-terminal cleavage/methylation domain-containing protein
MTGLPMPVAPVTVAPPSAERSCRGFSVLELIITMAIFSLVMGGVFATMTSAMRANEAVKLTTQMNHNLRVAMDLVVRDMTQVGQGLPLGRVVGIPTGPGAQPVRRPGPADPINTPDVIVEEFDPNLVALSAVTAGPGMGPIIDTLPTDLITTLSADNAFEDVELTALTDTSMTVSPDLDITDDPDIAGDNIRVGDLIMFTKQSHSTLKYVTAVAAGNVVQFDNGDPLNLNQLGAAVIGTLAHYVAEAPADVATCPPAPRPCTFMVVPTRATRIRMISYYMEDPANGPGFRLMRRINARPPTAVATSLEGFTITYDVVDDLANPTNVPMNAADLAGAGMCAPVPCSTDQVRKVNVWLRGRSADRHQQTGQFFRNTLTSQVSLRSLALVDRYS